MAGERLMMGRGAEQGAFGVGPRVEEAGQGTSLPQGSFTHHPCSGFVIAAVYYLYYSSDSKPKSKSGTS